MEITIGKHCVAQLANGLSPLQTALVADPRRVRIATAPTGAGKSYAFQCAMLQQKQRILFVVPTRRLAQNIAAGLVRDLIQCHGMGQKEAENRVAIWSSDQTLDLKEQGVVSVSGFRLRQMAALQTGRTEEGEMIVAIPEVVSHLLVGRILEPGQAALGVFDLLNDFDHIVFDEFHSIEARGFGLAGLLARLASVPLDNRVGFGEARISFLSATPLNIKPILEQLGVPVNAIAVFEEVLTDSGRPLHGDVTLQWVEEKTLPALIEKQGERFTAEIAAGHQVVVIYDALANLQRDLAQVGKLLDTMGIAPNRVLVINSIDVSGPDGRHPCGFFSGRRQNPDHFDCILATSSVELGLTFRDCRFMVMEPGFLPINFLQRFGRAARRGEDGAVLVRVDDDILRRSPWLRDLSGWMEQHQGKRMVINDLTSILAADGRKFFGDLSKRAIYCAGLYWQLLLDHPSNKRKQLRKHLLDWQPESSCKIFSLLKTVETMGETKAYQRTVHRWITLFKEQARTMRDIGPKIHVLQEGGRSNAVDELWLRKETTILERFPPNGNNEVHITGHLDDYFREEKPFGVKRPWQACFPHTQKTKELTKDASLVESWCRQLKDIDPYSFAQEDHPKAFDAAKQLVQLTGLVPGCDPDISMESINAVL